MKSAREKHKLVRHVKKPAQIREKIKIEDMLYIKMHSESNQ
jgi:hypothetical protein